MRCRTKPITGLCVGENLRRRGHRALRRSQSPRVLIQRRARVRGILEGVEHPTIVQWNRHHARGVIGPHGR